MSEIPKFVTDKYGGLRGFKAAKRKQILALLRALDELRCGCAYLPTGDLPVESIYRELVSLKEACSVKKWGR